jgi:hypothetical protein
MQQERIMSRPFGELRVHLNERDVVDIYDGEGLTVRCLDGNLWITQADQAEDVVLATGQSFVLNKPGLTLVGAPVGPAMAAIQSVYIGELRRAA